MLIPISHEDQTVTRLPWVTIGLLAVNIVVFLVTLPVLDRQEAEIRTRATMVERYAREHPYLTLPEELADDVSPAQPPVGLPEGMLAEQQAHLDRLVQEVRERASGSVYHTFGTIPAHPRLFTFVTSMFVHAGLFHLIWNMLFLWLAGPSLEDRWGRGLFLGFYLLSGVAADLAHMALNPQSTAPTVGASGAIAGLMGAFLIRLGATRIRFFYWLFYVFVGTFHVRAYVVLLFWLLEEILWALSGVESGVAVWAHLGGFGLGMVGALLIKATDLEGKVLAPAIEKKISWAPSERLAAALEKLDKGDAVGSIRVLEALLRAKPEDFDARMALVTAYARKGDHAAAGRESARIVGQQVKARNIAGALAAYREHAFAYHDVPLPVRDQLALAGYCEQVQEFQEAADLYRDAIAAWPDEPLAPTALLAYGRLTLQVFKRADDAVDLLERARAHPRAMPEIRHAASEALATATKARRRPLGGREAAPAAPPRAATAEPSPDAPRLQPPPPAEPAGVAPTSAVGGRLVPVPMRAVGIDDRGLHLQDRRGVSGVLAWQRVAAISVGRIGNRDGADAGASPLVLDLLMPPRSTPTGAEFRSARLSIQDLAVPQFQSETSPVRAFQRAVAEILRATDAPAHPSREACLSLEGLPAFPNLAAYEADVVARLTASE